MNKILYVKVDPHEMLHIEDFVEMYRDVFAAKPWHEWMKCPVCGKYWGKKDANDLAKNGFMHCGEPLVDFWPRHVVASHLRDTLAADSNVWFAFSQVGLLVGAIMTKVIDFDEFMDMFVGDHDFDPKNFYKFANKQGFVDYGIDILVHPGYRKNGIASKLLELVISADLGRGLIGHVMRVRRSPEPSVTYTWFVENRGYEVIYEYPEEDGRVIIGNYFSEISKS